MPLHAIAFHLLSAMIPEHIHRPVPRIFLAVDVPNPVRLALLTLSTVQIPGARIIRDESYHITLKFLGKNHIAPVARAARELALPAFDITLSSIGAFPSNQCPYTIFARAHSPGLMNLQSSLDSALTNAGFASESRRYQPHVTLAKLSPKRPDSLSAAQLFIDENDDFRTEPFRVNEFVLMESVQGFHGEPHYIIRDRFGLLSD